MSKFVVCRMFDRTLSAGLKECWQDLASPVEITEICDTLTDALDCIKVNGYKTEIFDVYDAVVDGHPICYASVYGYAVYAYDTNDDDFDECLLCLDDLYSQVAWTSVNPGEIFLDAATKLGATQEDEA